MRSTRSPAVRPSARSASITPSHRAVVVPSEGSSTRSGFDASGAVPGGTAAVTRARQLIEARQYVLRSDWGDVQPDAEAQNAFLKNHDWEEYAAWHLGLTVGAADETKARYAFVYGDFRRIHRTGLIACVYRASEWRHKEVELAAHNLLQHLDKTSG